MENSPLCSVCSLGDAVEFCICTPALPQLCAGHAEKHKASPGFHYTIPTSLPHSITSNNQREWKAWLFSLSESQQELRNSQTQFSKLREDVNHAYKFSIHVLKQQRVDLISSIDLLEKAVCAAINSAVQETHANCMNQDYHPTSSYAELIWNQACHALPEPAVSLFRYKMNISKDKIHSGVEIKAEFNVKELKESVENRELQGKLMGNWERGRRVPLHVTMLPGVSIPSVRSRPAASIPLSVQKEKPRNRISSEADMHRDPGFQTIWSCLACKGANLAVDRNCAYCKSLRLPNS